jgi:hypothetical protein
MLRNDCRDPIDRNEPSERIDHRDVEVSIGK